MTNVFACGARRMTNTRHQNEASENICLATDPLLPGEGTQLFEQNISSLPLKKRSLLGLALEKDVIPRLIFTYSSNGILPKTSKNSSLSRSFYADDIALMARLVIAADSEAAYRFIEKVKSEGATIESIYVDLLTPTARLLGEQWKTDQCCFTEVTVGTSRLQQLVHALSPEFEREAEKAYDTHRILFSPMPGEQHTLGLMIVEEYFRRAGWNCCKYTPKNMHDLLHMVRSLHFDVVGLSAGSEASLDQMNNLIEALRKVSLNTSVKILVGGAIFLENSNLAANFGADGTARDGHDAILQMQRQFGSRGNSS